MANETITIDPSNEAEAYRRLIDLGIQLSAERNHNKLMENILLAAKEFCNADAGTLYLMTEADTLCFRIIRNDSLDIAQGGTTGEEIALPDVKLFDEDGEPNLHNVSAAAAVTGKIDVRGWKAPEAKAEAV